MKVINAATLIVYRKENGLEVLMHTRLSGSANGIGFTSFAIGGKVEGNASLKDTVLREMREEMGDKISVSDPIQIADFIVHADDGKHYHPHFFKAEYLSGEIQNPEPLKHTMPFWIHIDKLKDTENLYPPVIEFIEKGYLQRIN